MQNKDINIIPLSVVIPVYNVEKYLKEAVDSVINLEPRPQQIVIVNDGSTDNSRIILEEHYSSLDFIKIVHTDNQGLGIARNVGTQHSTSEYIYYFDSDDLIDSDLGNVFKECIAEHTSLDIIAFSAKSFFDSDINKKDSRRLPSYQRKSTGFYKTGEACFCELSRNRCFYPNAWLYIFKKKILDDCNIKFKPIIHEDEDFTPQLFLGASEVLVLNKVLFHRRIRNGSIMQSNFSEKNIIGYLASIDSLALLIKNNTFSLRTKKYLLMRIRNNLINIISILNSIENVCHPDVVDDFNNKMLRFSGLLEKVATKSFFAYRILNFIRNRFFLH